MSSSNKRHSILPPIDKAGPRPPVNFSSSLTISDNAILVGTHSITIQSETVVHPRARLESMAGSVLVGRRCIMQERSVLGAAPATGSSGGVVLGDYVTIDVAAVVEGGGTEIGEGTSVGIGSRIGGGAKIGKVCITPGPLRKTFLRVVDGALTMAVLHHNAHVGHRSRPAGPGLHGCLLRWEHKGRQERGDGDEEQGRRPTDRSASAHDTQQSREIPINIHRPWPPSFYPTVGWQLRKHASILP